MALAEGAQATGDAEWLEAAQELADFLLENLFVDGHLQRSCETGQCPAQDEEAPLPRLGLDARILCRNKVAPAGRGLVAPKCSRKPDLCKNA